MPPLEENRLSIGKDLSGRGENVQGFLAIAGSGTATAAAKLMREARVKMAENFMLCLVCLVVL